MATLRWGRMVDDSGAPEGQEAGLDLRSVEGFSVLYRAAFPQIYSYLFHRCGGVAPVAEDLTQETFLAAVARVKADGGEEVSLPWLIGVARHKLVDHLRRKEREERKLTLIVGGDDTAPPDETISRQQALEALASVPPAQRAALVLRYLDDLPVPVVARHLGKSIHATESLLARGREKLRRGYSEARDDS